MLPPVSNRVPWIDDYKLTDDENGQPFDISDATEITVEIFDPEESTAKLSATLTGGSITRIETGVFEWTFTQAQMQTLLPKVYDLNISIVKDEIPVMLMICALPVIDRYSNFQRRNPLCR